MQKYSWKPLRIALALMLVFSFAHADELSELQNVVLTGNLFGRSSLDFRKNANNVRFVVPEGSEGTILETRQLRSGSYGIRIKLTKISESKSRNTPQEGDETWVYFSQKDPWLTLKDASNTEVDDPEIALNARARRDGEGLPALPGAVPSPQPPTRQKVLGSQVTPANSEDPNLQRTRTDRSTTEGDFCIACVATDVMFPGARQAASYIKDIQEHVRKSQTPPIPDAKWSAFPTVVNYSTSEEVQKAIDYGMRNKAPRSKRLCYRYVKRALLGGELVDDYLPGAYARNAVVDLQRRGYTNLLTDTRFKDLIKNPKDAPKGAVLVYRNTRNPRHAGHVEIKTDWGEDGGYVSDFFRNTRQNIPNRELIGVMIKENL